MHYFKMNIGDYAKKAGRLSMLEHGAYTLLIHACYDRERFPTLDDALDWCWVRTEEEKKAVEFVLNKFFTLDGDVYVQNRIREEIEKYHENSKTNKRIATDREEKRRAETRSVHEACKSVNEPPPNHKPLTINQEPLTINQETHNPPTPPEEESEKTKEHETQSDDCLVCVDEPFDVFWKAYPNKTAKIAAKKAFKKIKKPVETVEKILEALSWQAETDKWKRGYIPNPATYLNGGCWQDERPPQAHHPPLKTANQKFSAFNYLNGGDGYGNKREHEGKIIDIEADVVDEGKKRSIGYR